MTESWKPTTCPCAFATTGCGQKNFQCLKNRFAWLPVRDDDGFPPADAGWMPEYRKPEFKLFEQPSNKQIAYPSELKREKNSSVNKALH